MGCSDSKGQIETPQGHIERKRAGEKLKIFGDYFSADTRAAIVLCEMAGTAYDLEIVQQLKGENLMEPFAKINPTGAIPMLVWEGTQVVSSGHLFFEYLVGTQEAISQKFNHAEQLPMVNAIHRTFF